MQAVLDLSFDRLLMMMMMMMMTYVKEWGVREELEVKGRRIKLKIVKAKVRDFVCC